MSSLRFDLGKKTWLVVLASLWPALTHAQLYTGAGNLHEVFVGSETEEYIRDLSLLDTTSNEAWSIRPLSASQVEKLVGSLGSHPWAGHVTSFAETASRFEFSMLSPTASVRFNSAFPYGSNDGAIWAGRGLTFAVEAGVYTRLGPLSLTLSPVIFSSQNAAFPLGSSSGPCGCADPIWGSQVDRPQRFGSREYGRLDPGQSSIRLDLIGLAAGLSTANEGWGPSKDYPFLLGNNAPGFPHVFLGSSKPFPVLVGKAHFRVIYGRLDQSSYSPVSGSKFYSSRLEPGRVRFASGLIAAFQPFGLDGLEIGGGRFTHSIWPRSGIPSSYLKKPFQAFLKSDFSSDYEQQIAATDNQLASFFARWVFKQSGLEIYGEYGRDDHSFDLRDFLQEPDHERAYSLGLGKTMAKTATGFSVLRLELINFQLPPLATTGRGEGSIYTHSPIRQGHTNRGQLLGADVGVGDASGSTARFDHYSSGGRWGLFWLRNVRQETSDPFLIEPTVPQGSDVIEAVGFDRLRFTGRFDVTTSVTLMRDFSRNFRNSVSNLNAAVSVTLPR